MRRRLAFLGAGVALTAAIAVPVAAAATPPPSHSYPQDQPPGQIVQRYGILRYDTAHHRWTIVDTPLFQSSGLTGVTCASNGTLVVGLEPLSTIGTFTVDEDESYAGRYDAGATIASNALTITIRKSSTGAAVSCRATELQIANSNLQVLVIGTTTPPTDQPTPTWPTPTSIQPTPPSPTPTSAAPPSPTDPPIG